MLSKPSRNTGVSTDLCCQGRGTAPLPGPWQLSFTSPIDGADRSLPARVPGSIAVDLIRAEVIPDLYQGSHALEAQAWERTDFTYETVFMPPTVGPGERLELYFAGLDTVADIAVNGTPVGSTDNMFIPHTMDITAAVVPGANTLRVVIRNVVDFASGRMRAWGTSGLEMGHFQDKTPIYVRKAQHMFGWDIAPRMLFGGIWRPVHLRVRAREELLPDEFYLGTRFLDLATGRAELEVSWGCTVAPAIDLRRYEIEITGTCGDSSFAFRTRLMSPCGKWFVTVEGAKPWWPAGYGPQALYAVTLRLLRDGAPVDTWRTRVGLRTLHLDFNCVPEDTARNRFGFICNGVPIMVRGSNWVPVDALHAGDEERIPTILAMFRETNCNIVRVWGGSVYESPAFYDLCDDYGILVWQDFMFGCAMYPQHEAFRRIVAAEAATIVRQLRNHPAIALWAGDNEIDQFLYGRYGQAQTLPSDNLISRHVLKEVVAQYDHHRSYLPSSPYIPDELYRSRRMYATPEQHLWGPRGYFKSDFYARNTATFVSEIGYHGMPAESSLRRFLSPDKVWGSFNNAEWLAHATEFTCSDDQGPMGRRNLLMRDQVRHLFGDSVDLDDLGAFILASQITQAEAKKYFIEHFRSRKPAKTGVIWWNMIDCWPQFSDAVVDYYFERKLAYSFIRRAQEPVCLMVREDGARREIVAVNDTLAAVRGTWRLRDLAGDRCLAEGGLDLAPNGGALLRELPDGAGTYLLLEWTADGRPGRNHYVNVTQGPTFSFASEVYAGQQEHVVAAWDFAAYTRLLPSLR